MVVCLLSSSPPSYLKRPVGEVTTIARSFEFVSSLGNVERVRVVGRHEAPDLPAGWEFSALAALTESAVIDELIDFASDTDVLFGHLDQPFLNAELALRLLDRHTTYRADYTFADGYPVGLAPEIVAARVLPQVRTLCRDEPVGRQGLFPVVLRDINRFDVETELSTVDQRLLRLVLAVDTRANALACDALANGAPTRIDEWASHVESRRSSFRTLPRFVSVQVIEQEVQRLAYSPYPLVRADVVAPGRIMEIDAFGRIIEQIDAFAPEAVVHLSLWGELGLHPDALGLIRRVLDRANLSVLVETSGVGWDSASIEELAAIDEPRLEVIVGLDTDDPELYATVRGQGFEEAHRFAGKMVDSLGNRAHVQAVRSDLTERALDPFYRAWRERTNNVIIQKYDHFCAVLPERRIGDLSPLVRFPCWHLQRDLHILVDGTVPLCREDIHAERNLGNVFSDGIERVWAAGSDAYEQHVAGEYAGLCARCDEYYTFSF